MTMRGREKRKSVWSDERVDGLGQSLLVKSTEIIAQTTYWYVFLSTILSSAINLSLCPSLWYFILPNYFKLKMEI